MGVTVGIDLGTTNSVVACYIGQRIETIPNIEGAKTTPSVLLMKEDEMVVGELAKRQSATFPGQVIRSAKRIMGRRYSEVAEYAEDFPFVTVKGDGDRAEIKLHDGRVIAPEFVAAQVLQRMRETAEDYLGQEVNSAVITVPAHFNDQQRTATKKAAELIDLEAIRIINEPTAAALAYGLQEEAHGQVIAVFDFGGGTFDVSILQIHRDVFEVLSTNGDTQLGGDNIDLMLFQEICDGILQSTAIDPTQDAKAITRIYEAAEKAKIELSSLASTRVSLPFIVADHNGPKHFELEITREQFNEWMEPIFQSLLGPCKSALTDAGLGLKDIDEVILVGGSTRIPRVREVVKEFFKKEPNTSVNPDEAVAIGAAIQAGVMKGELQEVLLLDVIPLSLGIELAGGIFKPIIERNSSIPCEANSRFTTVVDNQEAVTVHVLQGERRIAKENRTLAKFRLTGIPPMPKELPEIEVTFRVDADGILEVSAVDLTSGVSTGVQIEGYGEMSSMGEEEAKRLVDEMHSFHREDEEFVRNAQRRTQAQRSQDRMQKILDSAQDAVTEKDLKTIKETMLRMDLAMASGDWSKTEHLESTLLEMIEKYEDYLDLHRAINRYVEPSQDHMKKPSLDDLRLSQSHEELPQQRPRSSSEVPLNKAEANGETDEWDASNAPPPPPPPT